MWNWIIVSALFVLAVAVAVRLVWNDGLKLAISTILWRLAAPKSRHRR